eukprot:s3657_g2.t1
MHASSEDQGFFIQEVQVNPPCLAVKRMCDAWGLSCCGVSGVALQELRLSDYQMLQQSSKNATRENIGKKKQEKNTGKRAVWVKHVGAMTYDTGDVAVQATETSCVGEPEMGRSADAEGDASPGKPMVWEVLSQRIEAEALERATAISRLTSFIEDAVASINQNLMDAAAQGAQKSKEETLPATWSGLEDVRKTISKLSETQTQQEDRIRGLAHKVDQVSGSHDILDRDQKATFREMSNSISDLNIKLGSRTSRLEEDFKALQEEVTSLQIEIRSTLNGALMTPSRSLSGVVCEGHLTNYWT